MQSNSLVYKANKTFKGQNIFVTISLNDDCKNGHQDFAITANIYEAGKPTTDRNMIGGGCCHDEIVAAFPEFQQFVDLHLCDYLGNPMYATANGFYHLKNEMGNFQPGTPEHAQYFSNYYDLTPSEFATVSAAQSVTHYALLLLEIDIQTKWKARADKAIAELERLTETKFIVDSVKDQFGMPSPEALQAEREKIANGYYSDEAIAERANAANEAFKKGMINAFEAEIAKRKRELDLKLALFDIGGKRLLDNVIYYNHTDTLEFNWRNYGTRIEADEAAQIMANFPNLKYEVK